MSFMMCDYMRRVVYTVRVSCIGAYTHFAVSSLLWFFCFRVLVSRLTRSYEHRQFIFLDVLFLQNKKHIFTSLGVPVVP